MRAVIIRELISGPDPDPALDLRGTAEIGEVVIETGGETEAGTATERNLGTPGDATLQTFRMNLGGRISKICSEKKVMDHTVINSSSVDISHRCIYEVCRVHTPS